MQPDAHDGRRTIELDGFSYLPHFISLEEGRALIEYFESLAPIWEHRHAPSQNQRPGMKERRLTRPVYWLGAWQFASLGYFSEPKHREGRCVRGEPFPTTMDVIMERLRPVLEKHETSGVVDDLPNTCLINFYGSELGEGPPRDQARLRMHQDGEPGPIVMFCIGQPGLLEFVEADNPKEAEFSVWTRHRSVVVFSGERFKDQLYHRITRVKHGGEPSMCSPVDNFSLRRVSVSFRHVPEELICDFDGLPPESQTCVRPFMEQLAATSVHYSRQLSRCLSSDDSPRK